MSEITKVEEKKEELKPEHKVEEHEHKAAKEGFNFKKWLRGSNQREHAENISFTIIFIAAIMVSIGILLGSFIQGTIFIAVFGSFFVIVGIVAYIISQFVGE